MRIAVIPAMERVADDEEALRAMLPVAGRRIARHQLDSALALGCESVAVYHEAGEPGYVSLEPAASRAGVKYRDISGLRDLATLVGAADEMVIFAEGVLPDPDVLISNFAEKRGILTLPADVGIPAGLERIDAEQAWAGVMVIRGEAVERTSFLPPDSDPASALLRIALQLGTRLVPLPEDTFREGEWAVIADEDDAARNGEAWARRHAAPSKWVAPGRAIADRIALRFAQPIADLPLGHNAAAVVAAGLLVAVAVLGWFNYTAIAMGILALSLACAAIGETAGRVESGGSAQMLGGKSRRAFAVLADVAVIVLAALHLDDAGSIWRIFPPLVLIAALHIASRFGKGPWKSATQDRIALSALLCACMALGWLAPALQVLALAALAVALLVRRDGG